MLRSAVVVGFLATACSMPPIRLDENFAGRANEVPFALPLGSGRLGPGFVLEPPSRFILGNYRVHDVRKTAQSGGEGWILSGKVDGPDVPGGTFDCTGPNERLYAQSGRGATINVMYGPIASLGCTVYDGAHKWTMTFDKKVILDAEGRYATRKTSIPNRSDYRQNGRDVPWDAVLRRDDDKLVYVYAVDFGYYVVAEDWILGALDVSKAPRAYIARDAREYQPAVALSMATVYAMREASMWMIPIAP